MLSEKEIEHLTEALHCTLQMLKEKDPENGHHFAPMYQRVKDKLEAIQNALGNQNDDCPLCGHGYPLELVTQNVTYDFQKKKGSMELVEYEIPVSNLYCSNCNTTFSGSNEARAVEDFQRKLLTKELSNEVS